MKHFKMMAFAGLLGALAVESVDAQLSQACLIGTGTNCPNQTIARDPNNPYQQAPHTKVRKVLLYDIGSHPQGKQAYRRALIHMAYRYGFELVISDAALGYITASTLAGVDVVIFSQGDGDRVPSTESATALKNFIYRDGKAMMMVHAAAAFITCAGTGTNGGGHQIDNDDATCRFMARAAARQYYHHVSPGTQARIYGDSVFAGQVPPYGSLGATNSLGPVPPVAVINHGRRNPETQNIFNNALSFNWTLPPNSPTDPRTTVWENWGDEWYDYYNNPGPRAIPAANRVWNGVTYAESRLNVILSLDELSVNFGSNRMGDHPQAWVRKMGNGLSLYSNIGHDNTPFRGSDGNGRPGGGRTGNDSVAYKITWNMIRFLARDYVGCMDNSFAEFNPDASVQQLTATDPATPCVTVSIKLNADTREANAANGVTVKSRGFEIATPSAGFYRVYVSDLAGRAVYSKTVLGGAAKAVSLTDLSKGSYFVRLTAPDKSQKAVRVDI